MGRAIILNTKPYAKYHFGEHGLESNTLNHSSQYPMADTLFSAIVNVYNDLFTDCSLFIEEFKKNLILLSSGCFVLENSISKKKLFFLHKPHILGLFDTSASLDFKKIKKIKFISKGIWEKGYTPSQFSSDEIVIVDNQFVCFKTELMELGITEKEIKGLSFITTDRIQKNHVHKLEKKDTLYSVSSVLIQNLNKSHLALNYYFLIDDDKLSDEWKEKLELVLTILPSVGLGGERSSGCGSFWGVSTVDLTIQTQLTCPKYKCSMSLIAPENLLELEKISYYTTIVRGGRILSGGGKLKQVRMITEGALVEQSCATIGQLVSIKPDTSKDEYLRYGKAFLLPIHENWTTLCN